MFAIFILFQKTNYQRTLSAPNLTKHSHSSHGLISLDSPPHWEQGGRMSEDSTLHATWCTTTLLGKGRISRPLKSDNSAPAGSP